MRKYEIQKKLDEIVDFAGVAKYLDTPVKRYSSEMYVRLAFAVAAHLDPDILIVDEVLAVGDAEFQKKAIGKMQDVSRGEGRTVLFVSHNMASVKALCNRGILLENGSIKELGNIDNIVNTYLKGDFSIANLKAGNPLFSYPEIDIYEIGIKAQGKNYDNIITLNDRIVFIIKYTQKTIEKEIHITIHLKDDLGNVIFTNGSHSDLFQNNENGKFEVSVEFPDNFFNWGSFFIDLYIVENRRTAIYIERDILSFTIINEQKEIGTWMGKEAGAIHPKFDWVKINLN
jgi:lipopolysaccharide transport system ATP-binding protein